MICFIVLVVPLLFLFFSEKLSYNFALKHLKQHVKMPMKTAIRPGSLSKRIPGLDRVNFMQYIPNPNRTNCKIWKMKALRVRKKDSQEGHERIYS